MSWKNSSMCSLSKLLTISLMASLLARLYLFLPGFVSTLSPRLSSKVFCLASLSSLWNALMLCQMLGRLLPLRLKDLLKDSMSLLVVGTCNIPFHHEGVLIGTCTGSQKSLAPIFVLFYSSLTI